MNELGRLGLYKCKSVGKREMQSSVREGGRGLWGTVAIRYEIWAVSVRVVYQQRVLRLLPTSGGGGNECRRLIKD